MLFNEKLIQRRKEKGMTQEDLAEQLSVSRQTVSKWENGDCMPDVDKFIRLSDILEISLDELAGREAELKPIVLPAPELPQPDRKFRRLITLIGICLLIGAACFCLGRYVFPVESPAERAQSAALPDTLQVTGFTMNGEEARFIANTDVDGTVFLYDEFSNQVKLPAVYKDGVYTVSGIPQGRYERVVFVISADGRELSALVAEQLMFLEDGISFQPVE